MPMWVNSDYLRAIGFLGMILAGVSHFLAKSYPIALVAAVICLGYSGNRLP